MNRVDVVDLDVDLVDVDLDVDLVDVDLDVDLVDVALRAASTLENCVLVNYLILGTLQNVPICLVLSFGSMLDLLVLKNAVECTSQRLKWTSGAQVVPICCLTYK